MTRPSAAQAELEAARWLEALDTPHAPPALIESFQARLAAEDAHKRAYAALAARSSKVDAYLRLPGLGAANDSSAFYVDESAIRARSARKMRLGLLVVTIAMLVSALAAASLL